MKTHMKRKSMLGKPTRRPGEAISRGWLV